MKTGTYDESHRPSKPAEPCESTTREVRFFCPTDGLADPGVEAVPRNRTVSTRKAPENPHEIRPALRGPHAGVSVASRFWGHVDRRSPAECWPWMAARTRNEWGLCYGSMRVAGRTWRAHRLAFELGNGPIPDGLVVRHLCHNTLCCNPGHLATGTHKDNSRDMVDAGRCRNGGRAKLTDATASLLISRLAAGDSARSIARRVGVSIALVYEILHGRCWGHLPRPASVSERARRTVERGARLADARRSA